MRSQACCLAAAAAFSLAVLTDLPAHAGWGSDLSRVVVTGLVRQYATRLIQRSLYQPGRSPAMNNYGQPNYGQSNYGQPSAGISDGYEQAAPVNPPHTTTHHQHSNGHTVTATAHGALRYPTDQKFIPPPPPFPTVYPGGADTSISSMSSKSSIRGNDLVPPPPPSPSIWSDLEPVSQVSATPIASHTVSQPASKLSAPVGNRTASPLAKKYFATAEDEGDMPKAAPDLHRAHTVATHTQHHSGT
jgi:hypothetical protein